MDFILDLANSEGMNLIFVEMDSLTKMAHFISCNKTMSGEETAKLFLNIYHIHRFFDEISSNKGTQFVSNI